MSRLPFQIEDRVRAVAHSLWIEEGMPEGRAEAHWLKALDQVHAEALAEAESENQAKPKPKRKTAAAARAKKPAAKRTAKS